MPTIYKEDYGKRSLPDGQGYIEIVPTTEKFFKVDGSDVRLDRVYVYGPNGELTHTFLQDKMGGRFVDDLSGIKDDPSYLEGLPSRKETRIKEKPKNTIESG